MSGGANTAKSWLHEQSLVLGLEAFGVVKPEMCDGFQESLNTFLQRSHHGTMAWMETTRERRSHPLRLWPETRSVVMFGLNYAPDDPPGSTYDKSKSAMISVYARGRDYHDVFKGKLKRLAQAFAHRFSADVKVFVDTAPVMEKPLAALAGLGWQGKHTNLVSRRFGSWLFLGALFTDIDLEADEPANDACGSCRACLDVCPTKAFPAPYQLDARRCISYLTIEHKGVIERGLRSKIGGWIYGCDECLAVCPWNKFAQKAREIKLKPRESLTEPDLETFLGFDEAAFRRFFSASPIKRIGRDRFVRNVLIAAANLKRYDLAHLVSCLLEDASFLVRGAAVWSLFYLSDAQSFESKRRVFIKTETDTSVLEEWRWAHEQRKRACS